MFDPAVSVVDGEEALRRGLPRYALDRFSEVVEMPEVDRELCRRAHRGLAGVYRMLGEGERGIASEYLNVASQLPESARHLQDLGMTPGEIAHGFETVAWVFTEAARQQGELAAYCLEEAQR